MTHSRRPDEEESRHSPTDLRRFASFVIGAGACAALLVGVGSAAADPGDAERGRATFTEKQCARCHLPRGTTGSGPARDPAPDFLKGHLLLLRKGCLKCHSLAREGGRVEPDLAEPRANYDSGAAWAAAMWTHTPGMAAMAAQKGIPYPRFSGEEMGNLVGFLRHAAATTPQRRTQTAPSQ